MLSAFIVNFLAYLFVLIIIVAVVLAACFIGITWRKNKTAKAMENGVSETDINA